MKYSKLFLLLASAILFFSVLTGCGGKTPELLIGNEGDYKASVYGDFSQEASNSGGYEGDNTDADIYVHISGCVNNPGLYELPSGSRLYDGITAAGGFNKWADQNYANLAEVMQDGQKYEILSWSETEKIKNSETGNKEQVVSHYDTDGKLDINQATENELKELPGIGGSKASAIIKYRNENGDFADVNELTKVSGIGTGIFAQISDYVIVR